MSTDRILSLEIAPVDDDYTAGSVLLAITYPAAPAAPTYRINGQLPAPVSDFPGVVQALDEFEVELASSTDPSTDSRKRMASGQELELDAVAGTIKFGGGPTLPAASAFAVRDTLRRRGLAPAAP